MDNIKTIEDSLKNGTILQGYGKKYLVTVTLAPSIHKVRWSIVELGTNGKVHSDFYLGMKQMHQLCEDITSGVAQKRFSKDIENQYPSAYKFVTGENGCKKLNIGGGQIGIRVQIQINTDGKWDNKMSAVTWEDLREMGFYFNLVTGLIPVTPGSYYDKLYKCFWDGEANRGKYFSSYKPEHDGEYKAEEVEPSAETAANVFSEVPKPEKVIASENNTAEYRLKVSHPLTSMAGEKKALKGITEDNREIAVIFSPELMRTLPWQDFEAKASRVGSIIKFKGIEKNERVYANAI